VILVHLKSGNTFKLNAENPQDCSALDHTYNQKGISRVSILDDDGHRVDLPSLKNRNTRVWIEPILHGNEIRGERVSLRNGREIMQVSSYFSDGRVVIDIYG